MSTERDWPDDFLHENGNYQNTCINCKHCKQTFMGHKRRPICRKCSTAGTSTERVSDEELVKMIGWREHTLELGAVLLCLKELQQRRETDRRVIEFAITTPDRPRLDRAISELLP